VISVPNSRNSSAAPGRRSPADAITTSYCREASSRASSNPIPLDAPVTRASAFPIKKPSPVHFPPITGWDAAAMEKVQCARASIRSGNKLLQIRVASLSELGFVMTQ
jgi:hypothetical protein